MRELAIKAFTAVAKEDGGSYFDSMKRMRDGSWPSISNACIFTCIL